ncbi:beta-glucosidase [Niveomyces insectorum RCEF 264]|uniref:beta-glucosidase n=1 Tax=Niveomyces insectorum RCEF 264 TaxID=1081102 RepID=A0A167MFY5_9HYPO|nr:beta-glucosidase [Niveomyces insectorum RCEF 264]
MLPAVCVALAVAATWARAAADYVAAPYYPTPQGGWDPAWTDSYDKARALVAQMTLAEKVNVTSGTGYFMANNIPCAGNTGSVPRLGFPRLCFQDSALGVHATDHATAFPAGITAGATWDKELLLARGVALGQEFRGKGVNVALGPTIGPLGRKPRGGRNWESFGADPVLQAVGGALTVRGLQSQGVIATIKHLVGNEQEMYRMSNVIMPGYSSNIDDRVLHELYLWPFAEAVHAGAGAVMTAYNAVNGSACSQNSFLLNGLLKDELGFQGFVMSDWLGQYTGVASALAGLDMAMPGDTMIPLLGTGFWMYEMTRAVLNGSVPLDRLDDMATRVLATWYQMGQDAADYPPPNFSSFTDDATGQLYPGAILSPTGIVNEFVDVRADHGPTVARQIATDSITLLKNENSLLPLSPVRPLVVFGTDAAVNPDGANACLDRSCNTGTLGMGWGSGTANYPSFDDPITALRNRSTGGVAYYNTDEFPSNFLNNASDDDAVALVFLSADAGENQYTVDGNHGDRDASGLAAWHGGDALVQAVAAVYPRVVVVLHTVGPVLVDAWVDLPAVQAVLVAHLPGQEAGASLADVLYGDVTPSGHLPYSIPLRESDYPASITDIVGFTFGQPQDTYSEGLYIDYRYLQANGIAPRYAFGHGLSYANFSLSRAAIRVVTPLTDVVPPARPTKPVTPAATTTIPSVAEATTPAGFAPVWRYLYPWLSADDAADAAALGASGSNPYPYPDGYSTIPKTPGPPAGGPTGGNPALWDVAFALTVTVTNTNIQAKTKASSSSSLSSNQAFGGRAVVQAYLQFPATSPYDTPVVQLRDFAKTAILAPGAAATLNLQLTRKDLSVWDVTQQNWVLPGVPNGGGDGDAVRYTIWLGEASDQLHTACYTDTLTCESGLDGPSSPSASRKS